MPIETITVQYVNEPKPGKKMGSIKATDGRYFGVYPDKLGLYFKGQAATIEYDASEVNGRTFYNVRRKVDAANGSSSASPQPAASQGGTNQRSEEMFVMGFLNRFYDGAGSQGMTVEQLEVADLTRLIRKLRLAWHDGFEGGPLDEDVTLAESPKTFAEELNDEIPF
jgi:hypothetical protein